MVMNTISLISSPTYKIAEHLTMEIPLQLLNVLLSQDSLWIGHFDHYHVIKEATG